MTHLSLHNNPLVALPNELQAPKLEILLLGKDEHWKDREPDVPRLIISPGNATFKYLPSMQPLDSNIV